MGPGRGQLLNVYTPGGIDKFFLAAGIPIHSSSERPQVDLAAYEARTKPLREKAGSSVFAGWCLDDDLRAVRC